MYTHVDKYIYEVVLGFFCLFIWFFVWVFFSVFDEHLEDLSGCIAVADIWNNLPGKNTRNP